MITEIRHFGIYVSDLEKSVEFYKGLGLSIVYEQEERWETGKTRMKLDVVKFKSGKGSLFELIKIIGDNSKHKYDSHIAFTVNNIEETCKILKERNVPFLMEPRLSPDGSAKVAFIKDPDNFRVELVEVI